MYGIKGYSGAFDPGLLLPANRLQAHCGQDDVRQFADSEAGVGLAHVCLSIIDPPLFGQQPMASDNGSVVLVFNGEIYNSKELRSNLETKGYRFRSNSDTEVLLNFYLHHGEKVLHHLNGIFAFAIWDRRNGSLFIARDALGVKPLYYAETSQGVVFASDIKSLMSLTPFLHELDIPALHRYLSYLWCPGEGTPLKTLRKLPPGEAMMVRDGEIVRRWTCVDGNEKVYQKWE